MNAGRATQSVEIVALPPDARVGQAGEGVPASGAISALRRTRRASVGTGVAAGDGGVVERATLFLSTRSTRRPP